jgi:hypothetical protein
MNATILTTATFATVMATVLPARAADPQLLNLVMPDATVVAGVNVEQAKTTPFGQYVLSLIQPNDPHLKEIADLTGFDPTRDVREVLVASNGTPGGTQHSGLALARGNFDPARIVAAATSKGAQTEVYNGVTIIGGPADAKQEGGIAFLDATTVVAGDLANVKAAIARRTTTSNLPASLAVQINQWSTTEDAWAVSLIPTASLHTPAGAPPIPGVGTQNNAFTSIQQAAGGVKFGSLVVLTAQAQADTAQNAQAMGDALKLLASLAQLQGTNDAAIKSLTQSLTVSASGNLLNVSASIPQDQVQQLVKPRAAHPAAKKSLRRM